MRRAGHPQAFHCEGRAGTPPKYVTKITPAAPAAGVLTDAESFDKRAAVLPAAFGSLRGILFLTRIQPRANFLAPLVESQQEMQPETERPWEKRTKSILAGASARL